MTEDWDQLRYFLALARSRTLGAAAGRLKVSHTTVLRRIRTLEDDVRARLFERTPDGWVLTGRGERMMAEAERVEGALAALSREIVGADERVEGAVAITAAPALASFVLPPIVAELKRRHPGLTMQINGSSRMVDLSRREADIAVRVTDAPPAALVGRRVGEIAMVLCASPAYLAEPAGPGSIEGHRYVVDDVHLNLPAMRWLAPHLGSPAVTYTDDLIATGQLCRAGLGIALLPRFLGALLGLVVVDPAPMAPIPLWLLTHRDLRAAARIRATMAVLADGLRAALESVGVAAEAAAPTG